MYIKVKKDGMYRLINMDRTTYICIRKCAGEYQYYPAICCDISDDPIIARYNIISSANNAMNRIVETMKLNDQVSYIDEDINITVINVKPSNGSSLNLYYSINNPEILLDHLRIIKDHTFKRFSIWIQHGYGNGSTELASGYPDKDFAEKELKMFRDAVIYEHQTFVFKKHNE